MAEITSRDVLERLKTVRGPDMDGNIVDLGLVSDVFISDGKAYFSITVPAERAKELEPLRLAAERVVREMPGMNGAFAALTADKKAGGSAPQPARPQPGPAPRPQGHAHAHPARPAGNAPAVHGISRRLSVVNRSPKRSGAAATTTMSSA